MQVVFQVILLSAFAGFAAFAGALLGCLDEDRGPFLSDKIRRGIIAFGGGALIGAVGLVLVPHGLESQPLWLGTATFLAGGLIFLCVDRFLKRRGTPVSQLIALMLDFIPEAMVLGAVITENYSMALFLAVIIAAQNLPEGFNAYREMREAHDSFLRRKVLWVMAGCIVVGPVAALTGYTVFRMDSLILGSMMTFCAGGILYLVLKTSRPRLLKRKAGILRLVPC